MFGCDDCAMSDDGSHRSSFEDALRAIAQEITRSVERVSETDLDDLARATGVDPDRARQWADEAGQWLRAQVDGLGDAVAGARPPGSGRDTRPAPTPSGEDVLHGAGPHPLDVPTTEQGMALAALDSGRWTLEPGTSALTVSGDGPGPSDALGLVRELRVRDWIGASGEVTLAGHHALRRWLQRA
jgi:hypothetical protein